MENLVQVAEGQVVVSSRQVAEHFGKRHDKLLHEINRMYDEYAVEGGVAQNGGDPVILQNDLRSSTEQTEIPRIPDEPRRLFTPRDGVHGQESP